MIDARSALAAERFPKEWAIWSVRTGPAASKRRQQLRKTAEDAVKMDSLRDAGASCGTCSSFKRKGPCGPHCLLDTDFYGYATTTATDLCVRWSEHSATIERD